MTPMSTPREVSIRQPAIHQALTINEARNAIRSLSGVLAETKRAASEIGCRRYRRKPTALCHVRGSAAVSRCRNDETRALKEG